MTSAYSLEATTMNTLENYPKTKLIEQPTPVYALTELGEQWHLPGLYVKREDLTAPIYGVVSPNRRKFRRVDR